MLPALAAWGPNHWTTREIPIFSFHKGSLMEMGEMLHFRTCLQIQFYRCCFFSWTFEAEARLYTCTWDLESQIGTQESRERC